MQSTKAHCQSIERLEELLRLDRGVLGHVRKKQLLVSTDPFLHVPLERKPHIILSYRTQAYRPLQPTDLEQKAVIFIGDESLCLRALRPGRLQGRFDCNGNIIAERCGLSRLA